MFYLWSFIVYSAFFHCVGGATIDYGSINLVSLCKFYISISLIYGYVIYFLLSYILSFGEWGKLLHDKYKTNIFEIVTLPYLI